MAWKKSFRKLPRKVLSDLVKIESNKISVIASKIVNSNEVDSGVYAHIGLNKESCVVGGAWEILPSKDVGPNSKKNCEGWYEVRKDLPKHTKYFYQDIQNYGDGARFGWSTVAIPKEIYERDEYPPYAFHVQIRVKRVIRGLFEIIFSVDEIFDKDDANFDRDILFGLNLLQENTGVSGVAASGATEIVPQKYLDWAFFPPENLEELKAALLSGRPHLSIDVVTDRLELFRDFSPRRYLKGMGGNDLYVGAQYADDLVVFENMKYGNALYVLYGKWEELSKKSRSELLVMKSSEFDRIVHTEGWKNRFAVLMQEEFKKRKINVKIGRPGRRRRR
ncbi:MAG: hypothetical protein VYB54_05180 [Pseudomonadota bacterium]|nr:hypothetical protein [Pseudomonadota bacterium]